MPTLYEQIQQMQQLMPENFQKFNEQDQAALEKYASDSKTHQFRDNMMETIGDQEENLQMRNVMDRLSTLAAHHPKNSPQMSVLREHIPDIGKLRREKLAALHNDASRSGMDKLLNDFSGSLKRAAKAELKNIRESRTAVDSRPRTPGEKFTPHSGRGKNLFSGITNEYALGTEEDRINSDYEFTAENCHPITHRTPDGLLDGAWYEPTGEPTGKVVLVFTGSGDPAEKHIHGIRQAYQASGATVVCMNYRGFGYSVSRDKDGKVIDTVLSEDSIYKDGMEMYKYVRDVMGVRPENIILHGYSMGGAVASKIAADVAERNDIRQKQGEAVEPDRKLGGLVLQSAMGTMYDTAKNLTNSSFNAFFGWLGSGGYNTRAHMQRLHKYDPDIPVHYVSGMRESGDHLSLQNTNLHNDPKARFNNSSCTLVYASHMNTEAMLQEDTGYVSMVKHGRNAVLNPGAVPALGRNDQPENKMNPIEM